MFRRLLPKPVANSGSQLRDHQANERTFLSWTRMGLAFAALSLALGRLNLIDQVFNPNNYNEQNQPSAQAKKEPKTETKKFTNDLLASRMCQAISVWSFGYGAFRYLSVRRNLLQGRFVPAIWGPVLMSCGCFGVFGTMVSSGGIEGLT